ncbi:hypothetical protein U1Q18_049577 [Sarracenia purpurea var. burkii]
MQVGAKLEDGRKPHVRQPILKPRARSKATQPSSTRKRVAVFDFDDTLCKDIHDWEIDGINQVDFVRKNHPECPTFEATFKAAFDVYDQHHYVCLPYLRILFEYLFDRGVRIVFFSSAERYQNVVRIPLLLARLLGNQTYESLKSKGQFDIFSREEERLGNRSTPEGNYVKDLRVVVRDGESLSDAVLVDDDPCFASLDQHPCLVTLCLFLWTLRNESESIRSEEDDYNFAKNSIYYMLGVFKTYFEHEKYRRLPFRQGLDHIVPRYKFYRDFVSEVWRHPLVRHMIDVGLSEVQKQVPSATFYGLGDFNSSQAEPLSWPAANMSLNSNNTDRI